MSEPIGYCHLQYNEDGSFFADCLQFFEDPYANVPVYLQTPPLDEFANIGWLRAVDDEMTGAHIGVANLSDSYESARQKLNALIQWHIDVALDPAVNGGYSLQKVEQK
jgi:hypothetical protein